MFLNIEIDPTREGANRKDRKKTQNMKRKPLVYGKNGPKSKSTKKRSPTKKITSVGKKKFKSTKVPKRSKTKMRKSPKKHVLDSKNGDGSETLRPIIS